MILNIELIVSPEAGVELDRAEVSKDLQLYLMDLQPNLLKLETPDIKGGFYTFSARVR